MTPQEKPDVLRGVYDSLNKGDLEAALRYADDNFVVQRAGPDPAVLGKDAVRAFVAPDAFSEQVFDPHEFRENGNNVFVWLTVRATGAGSGITMEQQVAHVWKWRDGRVASLTVSFGRGEALELAGLSE